MKITKEELSLCESQTTEYKRSLSLQKEGFRALCGMLNADPAHGCVYFGVDDDGSVVGLEPGSLDRAQQKLATTVQQKFDPTIILGIDVLQCNDKELIRLTSWRGEGVRYHVYDGRAYIREGSTTRVLSESQKQRLEEKRCGNAQRILEAQIFGRR